VGRSWCIAVSVLCVAGGWGLCHVGCTFPTSHICDLWDPVSCVCSFPLWVSALPLFYLFCLGGRGEYLFWGGRCVLTLYVSIVSISHPYHAIAVRWSLPVMTGLQHTGVIHRPAIVLGMAGYSCAMVPACDDWSPAHWRHPSFSYSGVVGWLCGCDCL
jgi:hypothetical protein